MDPTGRLRRWERITSNSCGPFLPMAAHPSSATTWIWRCRDITRISPTADLEILEPRQMGMAVGSEFTMASTSDPWSQGAVSAGFRYKSALETHFHRHRPSRLLDVWASQLRPVLCSFFVPPWAGKWTPLRGIASESMLKTGSVVSSVFAHGMGLVLRQGSIPYVDPFF